jgi:hypothetical protein
MKKFPRITAFVAMLAACALLGWATTAQAVITLTDGNSSATIDPSSQSGMNNWTVDGTNQLYQQWFWYRVGPAGGQSSIDTLGAPTVVQPVSSFAQISYASNGLISAQVTYSLSGGTAGSGMADIAEQLRIVNTSGHAETLHFFQYSDFDLNDDPNSDSLSFVNANTVRQQNGALVLAETVVTPAANHFQGDYYANILNGLNSGSPFTLGDVNNVTAPGDATWAYEWDVTLAAGGSLLISKDKQVRPVPEPASVLVWVLLGGLGLAAAWRCRKSA